MGKRGKSRERHPRADKRGLKATTVLAVLLGVVLCVLVVVLAYRADLSWEVPIGSVRVVSERTRDVLAETQGTIRIVCFMERSHPVFRPLSRLLRGLQQASKGVAGAEIVVEYVDPRWDVARAGQLVERGVPQNALQFEQRRGRRVVVTLDEMLSRPSQERINEALEGRISGGGWGVFRGEVVCATAIARLSRPREQLPLYWLQGHGEVSYQEYDELYGYSDIAREIRNQGFEIRELNLPGLQQIPDDCQVLLIAGVRFALTSEEVALIELYLSSGGRVLALLTPQTRSGLEPLFERWGIGVTPFVAVSPRTITGQETVISEFANHPVTRELRNASLVFNLASCLDINASSERVSDADKAEVVALALSDEQGWGELEPLNFPRTFDPQSELKGPVVVAALSERGGRAAQDVAYRPGRLCVIGETGFVMNSMLATRASANRDFLLNVLGWLAGIEGGTGASVGGDATLVTGFSRSDWGLLMGVSAGVIPLLYLVFFSLVAWRSKR